MKLFLGKRVVLISILLFLTLTLNLKLANCQVEASSIASDGMDYVLMDTVHYKESSTSHPSSLLSTFHDISDLGASEG